MTDRRKRRTWSDDEKRMIITQTLVPGVSVSQVARRYDVNANLVFKWLRDPQFGGVAQGSRFLPVEISPPDLEQGCREPAGKIGISLANGHRLEIIGGFDPVCVVRLVYGLMGNLPS